MFDLMRVEAQLDTVTNKAHASASGSFLSKQRLSTSGGEPVGEVQCLVAWDSGQEFGDVIANRVHPFLAAGADHGCARLPCTSVDLGADQPACIAPLDYRSPNCGGGGCRGYCSRYDCYCS